MLLSDRMFFSLLLHHFVSVCIYGLWNEAVRGKSRRTVEGKMAISMWLLNWTVPLVLLQDCVVLRGRAQTQIAHTHTQTHWQMGKPCFLFISPLQALRQTPLIPHAGSHMWLLCPLSVCWHLTADFSLPVCWVYMHIAHACAYLCAVMSILDKTQRPAVIFWTIRRQGCFQPNFHPLFSWIYSSCMCEWLHRWEGFAAASFDSPLGVFTWLWPCNAITDHLEILGMIHAVCFCFFSALELCFYLCVFCIYSNPGSQIYSST